MITGVYSFILTDDYKQLLQNASDSENGQTFVILTSMTGCMGVFITLSVLCVVNIGGPIAVNVSGIIKDVFLTYVGFIFFDDQEFNSFVALGLALSFVGAINWVYFKFMEDASKTDDKVEGSKKEQ